MMAGEQDGLDQDRENAGERSGPVHNPPGPPDPNLCGEAHPHLDLCPPRYVIKNTYSR